MYAIQICLFLQLYTSKEGLNLNVAAPLEENIVPRERVFCHFVAPIFSQKRTMLLFIETLKYPSDLKYKKIYIELSNFRGSYATQCHILS